MTAYGYSRTSFQNLGCVVLHLYLLRLDDTFDRSVFTNDECCTECAEIFATVHALLAPHAEHVGQDMFRICLLYTSDAADEY